MGENNGGFLTPGQKKLAGFTLSFACLTVIAGLLALVVVILGKLVSEFSGMLLPLAIAGVLALMLRPVVRTMEFRLRMGPTAAVIALYGAMLAVVLAVLSFLLPVVFRQVGEFVEFAPELFERATQGIKAVFPQWAHLPEDPLGEERIQEFARAFSDEIQRAATAVFPALLRAGETVVAVFATAVGLSVIPVYLFFFLRSDNDPAEDLHEFLPFLNEHLRRDAVFLAREFIGIVVSFFRGQLVIALIVGILLAGAFTIAGLKLSIPIGLFLGLLNVVPFLGVIIGLLIAVPTALFQPDGGWQLALAIMGIFAAVQTIESTLLTPKIMGERTGLHPVAIIIGIFFWGTALGGLLGIILAIPLTAFVVTVWRLGKTKYFPES